MISKELELTFAAAVQEAKIRRHGLLTIEHILYSLLHDTTGSKILRLCGADIPDLKKKLEKFLRKVKLKVYFL